MVDTTLPSTRQPTLFIPMKIYPRLESARYTVDPSTETPRPTKDSLRQQAVEHAGRAQLRT